MKIDISKIYGLYEVPEYGIACKREKIINELKEKIQINKKIERRKYGIKNGESS